MKATLSQVCSASAADTSIGLEMLLEYEDVVDSAQGEVESKAQAGEESNKG